MPPFGQKEGIESMSGTVFLADEGCFPDSAACVIVYIARENVLLSDWWHVFAGWNVVRGRSWSLVMMKYNMCMERLSVLMNK
jgi:hypothetical protein